MNFKHYSSLFGVLCRLVHGTYFSVPSYPIPWQCMPVPSYPIPRDYYYNIHMKYSSIKTIKFMKVTKINRK